MDVGTLYIDDSGNTGPHLVDDDQPFGVTAMILFGSSQKEEVKRRTLALKAKLRQPPKALKFSHLSKRTGGAKLIEQVMQELNDQGVQIFFGLTEKLYLAAALFVEVFLDPRCNAAVPRIFIGKAARTMAANLVYSVTPTETLKAAAGAARDRDAGMLTNLATRVASLLSLHPADEARALADVFAEAARDPFIYPKDETLPRLIERPTAHTFTFVTVLGIVDQHLRARDLQVDAIADVDLQFGPVLEFSFKLAQDPNHFPNPYSNMDAPIRNIRGLTYGKSTQEIGIQLADLCAGLIASAARAAREQRPTYSAWGILKTALLNTSSFGPASFWQVSERSLRQLTETFSGVTPVPEPDGWRW